MRVGDDFIIRRVVEVDLSTLRSDILESRLVDREARHTLSDKSLIVIDSRDEMELIDLSREGILTEVLREKYTPEGVSDEDDLFWLVSLFGSPM